MSGKFGNKRILSSRERRRMEQKEAEHEKRMRALEIEKQIQKSGSIMAALPGETIQERKIRTRVEVSNHIARNGITAKDLEENYALGFDAGFKEAVKPMLRCYYAATILAAHKLYGFGQERCLRLLHEIEKDLIETLTSMELADRVMREVGIEMDFSQPVEIAQPVSK